MHHRFFAFTLEDRILEILHIENVVSMLTCTLDTVLDPVSTRGGRYMYRYISKYQYVSVY